MNGAIRFIRKAGRIIPLRATAEVSAAVGAGVASGIVAQKARQATMETIRGKGKKGTGNAFATNVVDFAGATILANIAAKRFPIVARGFSRITTGIRGKV